MSDTDTDTEAPAEAPAPVAVRNVLGVRLEGGDLYIVAVMRPGVTTGHRRYDRQLAHWTAENNGTRPDKLEDVIVYDRHINLIPEKVLVADSDGWELLCRDRTAQETAELNGTETLHPLETAPVWRQLPTLIHDAAPTPFGWNEFSRLAPATASQVADWPQSFYDTKKTLFDGTHWTYQIPPAPVENARFFGTVKLWSPAYVENGQTRPATIVTFNDSDGYVQGEIKVPGVENAMPRIEIATGYWWTRE